MKNKGRILVIDDDIGVLHTAKMILKTHFEEVRTETSPDELINTVSKNEYDVIVLDMNFSSGMTNGKEGMFWLKKIMNINPNAHILVNTAYGDIKLAVDAMKEGAIDFLEKPWEKEKLLATVLSIYQLHLSKKKVANLETKEKILHQDIDRQYAKIITQSSVMQQIFSTIDKIASTDTNVLILGENGTGKELIAREIHRKSSRSKESFIKVDIGAIPQSLFESELFGHVKGAFTDAKESRIGRLEIASGGTLFLDEIGNIPLSMQAKLLTVLQNREVMKIGSNHPVPIDIRLICATNKDLFNSHDKTEFRRDLYYRINTVEILLPPLKERAEDIPLLTEHYVKIYSAKYHKGNLNIQKETIEKLSNYDWPGNIRELQHAIERAVILSNTKMLSPADFPLKIKEEKMGIEKIKTLNIEKLEKQAIEVAILKYNGNLTKASEELGIGRTTLYRKMRRYGIPE